ncbi:MAG: DUF2207 domain-containing protein [Pseudomonadota bacterium]
MTAGRRHLPGVALLAGLLLAFGFGTGHAAEEILRYDSRITVRPDGNVEVREQITVRAEGRQIRRGIYREFPTRYRDRYGNHYIVDFEVLRVTRDGRPEPFHTENYRNGAKLYVGSENVFLSPGEYRYEITYRTNHQVGFFDDYDELYWNVTGNDWAFPIRAASAMLVLPDAVAEEQLAVAAYTGRQGSDGQDFTSRVPSLNRVRIETTRTLSPGEGLTIAVGFPKGLVAEPSGAAKLRRYLFNNRGVLVGSLGLLAVLWYYLTAWNRVGRDPKPGIIIPRYEAPKGYSPASLRYVHRRRYDTGCLSAALVNLAVKGYVRLHQDKGLMSKSFAVSRLKTNAGDDLAPGENAILNRLPARKLEFERENHAKVRKVMNAHKASLKKNYRDIYFKENQKVLRPAVLVSVAVAGAGLVLNQGLSAGIVIVVVGLLLVNGLFFSWMEAPTPRGRKLLDHIDGLRLYLGVAERDELEQHKEPLPTFGEFEKMLPYAVALDCASTWVDRFETVLSRLEAAGGLARRNWYTGSDMSYRGIGRSVDSLGSALGGAIAASSMPPGSSSGSGGGGFSGGGGGGGGGGGW